MKKIAFLLLLSAIIFSCGESKHEINAGDVTNPATASKENVKGNLPVMEFKRSTKYDFGHAEAGEILVNTFYFKNTGKSDLIISDVSTSCGCTVSEYSDKPIRPGEEGSITLTFDTKGRHGHQTKRATVLTNAKPNRVILTITADLDSPER